MNAEDRAKLLSFGIDGIVKSISESQRQTGRQHLEAFQPKLSYSTA
jgi:hypothetical protein